MKNIALLFPGQGSQSVGMLSELAKEYPQLLHTFQEASQLLDYDVWQLVQQDADNKINQTVYTQVIMLTADVAVYRLLKELTPIKPIVMAGHSLGEYAALTCADAITFSDAVTLVHKRAELMQQFVPLGLGAMAAIVGLEDNEVDAICLQASTNSEQVIAANYNAIGQVVIAGHQTAVVRAVSLAEQANAKLAKLIPVSVPCHCPLLNEAAVEFGKVLNTTKFKTPAVKVISNVNTSFYSSPESIRTLLQQQLYSPVRWVETIQKIKSNAVETVIECGSGKVLSGLVKRIEPSLRTFTTNDVQNFTKMIDYCQEA